MMNNNVKSYCEDCLDILSGLSANSVDTAITSPPYWNQKEYSFWSTYDDYIVDVRRWVSECARVIKAGRHIFWVIPDKLPYPPQENGGHERLYMPIYADTERCAADSGLVCKFPIIWKKPHGKQKMFGSYPYPPTIIPTPMTERICIWRKPGKVDLSRKSELSRISKEKWSHWAQDLWEIGPETHIDHPAPYPVELAERIIILWSFAGDTILDPFMGSGTTGVAAVKLGRNFIGIEKEPKYFDIARKRIDAALAQPALFRV